MPERHSALLEALQQSGIDFTQHQASLELLHDLVHAAIVELFAQVSPCGLAREAFTQRMINAVRQNRIVSALYQINIERQDTVRRLALSYTRAMKTAVSQIATQGQQHREPHQSNHRRTRHPALPGTGSKTGRQSRHYRS